MISSKLPLYLRSNVSKDFQIGSLVVNPNIDFKIYKVLLLSQKHMVVIDEKLVLHKFKVKNFVSVKYVFDISYHILTAEKIPYTSISVSQDMFDVCKKLLESSGQNQFKEIFDNDYFSHVNDKFYSKINSKIIISSTKNESDSYHDHKDVSVSWIDHFATIKLKESNQKLYLSFARKSKVYKK